MKFQPVQWHDTLDSTHSELRRLTLQNPLLPNGTVIAAHTQTQGQGRIGRTWIAPARQDLTCSFLIRTTAQRNDLHSLTLVTAIAVADSLKKLNLHPQLKWPNDILINQKKIAGILAQHINLPNSKDAAVIIGLGLNINMTTEQANKIDQPATSILIETSKTNTVNEILTLILKDLATTIHLWQQKGFTPLRDQWLQQCNHLNREITLTNPNTPPPTRHLRRPSRRRPTPTSQTQRPNPKNHHRRPFATLKTPTSFTYHTKETICNPLGLAIFFDYSGRHNFGQKNQINSEHAQVSGAHIFVAWSPSRSRVCIARWSRPNPCPPE